MRVVYFNGKEAAPGDRVVDVNTLEAFVIERIDPNCPTANLVCVPAIAASQILRSAEMIPVADARQMIQRKGRPILFDPLNPASQAAP